MESTLLNLSECPLKIMVTAYNFLVKEYFFGFLVCLQQKMLTELLIVNEKEGKGYVPQCSPESGQFEPRQCSRNGLVCWCVNSNGDKLPGTMGSGDKVQCSKVEKGKKFLRNLHGIKLKKKLYVSHALLNITIIMNYCVWYNTM